MILEFYDAERDSIFCLYDVISCLLEHDESIGVFWGVVFSDGSTKSYPCSIFHLSHFCIENKDGDE